MSTQPKTRTVPAKPKVKPGNSASRRKTNGKKTTKLPGEAKLVIDSPGVPPHGGNGGNPIQQPPPTQSKAS